MIRPWYLTLHLNGPLVQTYLAARLERWAAEKDFMDTWVTPEQTVPIAPVEAASGAYMDAAFEAEMAAYVAALTESPGLPVGP